MSLSLPHSPLPAGKKRIYLDHAATSPLRPEARAAMEEGWRIWANPSSPHSEGRAARAALEDARARIKAALKWDGELIFTSGASEAISLAMSRAKVDRKLISAVEHEAVFRAAPDAEVLPVAGCDSAFKGEVTEEILAEALKRPGRALVAIQTINSETGSHQLGNARNPLAEMVREANGLFLSDCSQSACEYRLPDADMVVVSAHKLGGPIGIGALLVRDFAMLEPMGGHEYGYRMGTENMPAALGFAAALEAGGTESWAHDVDDVRAFRKALWDHGELVHPGNNCWHIIAVAMPTLSAAAQLMRFDSMGISVSAGSACSSGTLKRSRAMKAFGIDEDTASRTIRVSLGWNTTRDDLDRFVEAYSQLARGA